MLLRQLVSTVAQQLLCACITADMRMHNTCCACGGQLLCTNYYPDKRSHYPKYKVNTYCPQAFITKRIELFPHKSLVVSFFCCSFANELIR